MRTQTSLVIDNQYSMVTCPEAWTQSEAQEYAFTEIRHQLAKSLGPNAIWGRLTGLTQPVPDTEGVNVYVLSDRNNLTRFANVFSYARLLSLTCQIEWLGSVDDDRRQGILLAQAAGPDEITMGGLEYNKHGTSLRYKMLHERFQRFTEDGNNADALAPANMLGWNQLPVLFSPDKLHIFSGRGTVGGANLMQPGTCRVVRFTPERRFKTIKWKPLSRADKIAATFDVMKMTQQGWDRDQRTGALWLAQDTWINRQVTTDVFNDGRLATVSTCDFFRFTYTVRWKFFRRVASGQTVPDPPP